MHNARVGSQKDSSVPAAPILIFKNVPTRAQNNYQLPQPMMPMNVPNQQAPPVVYIDATDLARKMVTVISKRERYKKSGDIIEHSKKCRAYEFYGTLDPGQADKQVKTVEKAFTTLQLSDEEKVSNVYGLMFNKADNWLVQVRNLCREAFTQLVFKEEFNREYLIETFQKQSKREHLL